MTNDEIKKALLSHCRVAHIIDKETGSAIVYDHAQAWRVTVDRNGHFISSLELVDAKHHSSLTIARADECEIWETNSL